MDLMETLSSMAHDYLAIQGSATPSEWAFLSGGTTGTAKHNHLNVKVFESPQLFKSAYWNGHIGAHLEAEKHTIHLSDVFGANGDIKLGSSWKGKGHETDLNWLD